MAAHYQEEEQTLDECHNCGATENLALCSRCHAAHFCSRKCQKAYWPFHREWCRRNDFADHVEKTQPKFARFLRKHGKQAVLKDGTRPSIPVRPRSPPRAPRARSPVPRDLTTKNARRGWQFHLPIRTFPDEVDRLERKVVSMSDMYGRANPKPTPPSFDADDMRRMRAAEERDLRLARERDAAAAAALAPGAPLSLAHNPAWTDVTLPPNLGADTGAYKWRQNQTFVDIFIPLPVDCHVASDVRVDISSDAVSARVRGETVLDGDLYAPIKAEASTWIVADGVLEISLLKRNRRGNYENGASNADTFWYSVVREGGGAKGAARLALDAPPQNYYESEWIRDPEGGAPGYTPGRGSSGGTRARRGGSERERSERRTETRSSRANRGRCLHESRVAISRARCVSIALSSHAKEREKRDVVVSRCTPRVAAALAFGAVRTVEARWPRRADSLVGTCACRVSHGTSWVLGAR